MRIFVQTPKLGQPGAAEGCWLCLIVTLGETLHARAKS